ncbi:MAG TPA: phosphotransferase [Solirubrobacteraceae bacterium]|jgi:aminoglycoside phosphotransferase (APT) family kinase protein|nr:phosphotransferase [Solirubrobacteraceae bacterium]
MSDATTLHSLELLGEGRESETFAWRDGEILRLLRDPSHAARLDREEVAIDAAGRAGVRVPAVLGRRTFDGRPGLIMERVDGRDLLTVLARRPWRLPVIARTLGATHARLHAFDIDEGLPTVHEYVGACIYDPLVPDELKRPARQRLASLREGANLCHWDFHPANLLEGQQGAVVIDWTFALRGDAAADVARTRLIVGVGAPPPGASLLVRRFDALARQAIARSYLRAYRRQGPLDLELVARWEPLVALARLTGGIPQERDRLLATCSSLIS